MAEKSLPTSDARYRSYQQGGFIDTDAISAQGREGLSDVNAFEGQGYATADMGVEEAAEAQRVGLKGESERNARRRMQKRTGYLSDLLGVRYKKGLFGSKGPINKIGQSIFGSSGLISGLGKSIKKLGRGLKKVFSDVHLKENIDFVGKSEDGINIYEWNYNNDKDNRYRGVLAHELKKDYPEAVSKEPEGLAVDYSKIDVDFQKVNEYANKSKK